MFFQEIKDYIFSLRKFILAAFLIFVVGILAGYFATKNAPAEMEVILERLYEKFEPIIEMPRINQFLAILFSNGLTVFLAILLGLIFGVSPFLVLFSNGLVLGLVFYFAKNTAPLKTFFVLLAPHGIVEIPAIILAGAVGLKLGKTVFDKVFKKQGSVKNELNLSLGFFLKFLFPLLAIAAFIEVFITGRFAY